MCCDRIKTQLVGYRLLRSEADEDVTVLDMTTDGDFASKPAAAVKVPSLNATSDVNEPFIVFAGGAAAGKTFSWMLWAWRSGNGMAELVVEGTGILGTQAVVTYPDSQLAATNKFWADTLLINSNPFVKPFAIADGGGNNRIAKLWGDLAGCEWMHMEITQADGVTGTEAGDVSVYYSWF